MHSVAFVCTRAALLGLFALAAAAPAAKAQSHPRWQVEASVDHTGSEHAQRDRGRPLVDVECGRGRRCGTRSAPRGWRA